jgi:glycosyltransferase involved in cell wall biosynthesis
LPTGLAPGDFLKNGKVSASIRKGLDFGREKIYCTVSRLEEEKNVDFLIRSFAHYKRIAGHRFRLVIIGEGSRRRALETLAIELGLENDVVFTGCLPHPGLSYWYGACDAFVFASRSETQGIVLLEAMAAGLPVVAVEASGADDVVVNSVNGFRVCPEESAFAQVVSLLADQPGRLETLGERALNTARAYTAENTALKAQAGYYTLLAQKEAGQVAYTAY